MFAKLLIFVVFRPGNHGRPFTADSHKRCKSTVALLEKLLGPWPGNHGRAVTTDLNQRYKSTVVPLRKNIGPYDAGTVTYFGSKCATRNPMHFIGTLCLCIVNTSLLLIIMLDNTVTS